jgi:hypothetical protein
MEDKACYSALKAYTCQQIRSHHGPQGWKLLRASYKGSRPSDAAWASAPATTLVGGLVVAGGAAGLAIHQPVAADADINDGLAKAAVFFARAGIFRLLALCAAKFGRTGAGTHVATLSRAPHARNMTEVTRQDRDQGAETRLSPALARDAPCPIIPSNDFATSAGWR